MSQVKVLASASAAKDWACAAYVETIDGKPMRPVTADAYYAQWVYLDTLPVKGKPDKLAVCMTDGSSDYTVHVDSSGGGNLALLGLVIDSALLKGMGN